MGHRIAVIGAGNAGHAVAADLARNGHYISLFELLDFVDGFSKVLADREIRMIGAAGDHEVSIGCATTNIEEAVSGARIIFICVPSFAHDRIAELCAAYLSKGQIIALWPGQFSALMFAERLQEAGVEPGITIVEADTLPYAARLKGPGLVNILHVVEYLLVGVYPAARSTTAFNLLKQLYPQIRLAKNILEAGLSNVNLFVHPGPVILNVGCIERARQALRLWEDGVTPSVARVMEAIDTERLEIGRAFGLSLMKVAELIHKSGYGPKGTLWETINGSEILTQIDGPEDTSHRFFQEDIPNMGWLVELGRMAGVSTPTINSLVHIGHLIIGKEEREETLLEQAGIARLKVSEVLKIVESGRPPVV
jgi:opine dehydrogenase